VLQGIAATLLGDLQDGDLDDDEHEDDERAGAGVVVGDTSDVGMMAPPPPAAAPALPAPRGAPTPPCAPALVRGAAPAALSTAAPRQLPAKRPHVQGAAALESLLFLCLLRSYLLATVPLPARCQLVGVRLALGLICPCRLLGLYNPSAPDMQPAGALIFKS